MFCSILNGTEYNYSHYLLIEKSIDNISITLIVEINVKAFFSATMVKDPTQKVNIPQFYHVWLIERLSGTFHKKIASESGNRSHGSIFYPGRIP